MNVTSSKALAWCCLVGLSTGLSLVPTLAMAQQAGAAEPGYARDIQPLLAKYCFKCHRAEKAELGINLAVFTDEKSAAKAPKLWKKVREQLHSREMPPEENPKPSAAEWEKINDWVERFLKSPAVADKRDPGRSVPRRLTRVEYALTICELVPSMKQVYYPLHRLENYYDPAKGFPADGVSTMHWIGSNLTTTLRTPLLSLPADDVEDGFENLGEVLTLPPLLLHKYLAIATEILDGARSKKDVRVFVAQPGPNKTARQAAEEVVSAFAPRAFRRPVPPEEIARYLALFDQAIARGDSYDEAVMVPLQAILVSPHFLFRVEQEPGPAGPDGARPVGNYELASRLSYFLWSTMPDQQLLDLAKKGELAEPAVLEQQVRRMLKSPKSKALADSFATQWLRLDLFESAAPDSDLFPHFAMADESVSLRHPIAFEPLLFTEVMLVEDRSILEFVDSDWAVWNRHLADFYGTKAPPEHTLQGDREGWRWRRYALPDKRRGGVLTMAAVLTQTSNPMRTNPSRRGKWVLETILASPPPPPVANAAMIEDKPAPPGATFRQILERHRADATCASCHKKMDPLGLAFENYSPIGAWCDVPEDSFETTWRFHKDGELHGWRMRQGHQEELKPDVQGGRLIGKVSEANKSRPIVLESPKLHKMALMNQVVIRLKNGTASKKAHAYIHGSANVPGGFGRSVDIEIQPNSDFQDYTFDFAKVAPWSGTTEYLKIQPVVGASEGQFEVEWIRIGRTPAGLPRTPIDASGVLARGVTFRGPGELKQVLLTKHKDEFVRSLVEHMLTYALGRKLDYYDVPVVQQISQKVADNGYRFSSLVQAVAQSYPFLHRRTKEFQGD